METALTFTSTWVKLRSQTPRQNIRCPRWMQNGEASRFIEVQCGLCEIKIRSIRSKLQNTRNDGTDSDQLPYHEILHTQLNCTSHGFVPLSTEMSLLGFRGPEHIWNSLNFKLMIDSNCSDLSDTRECTSKLPVLLHNINETRGKSVHYSSSLIYFKFLLLFNLFPSFPPSLSGKYTVLNNGY